MSILGFVKTFESLCLECGVTSKLFAALCVFLPCALSLLREKDKSKRHYRTTEWFLIWFHFLEEWIPDANSLWASSPPSSPLPPKLSSSSLCIFLFIHTFSLLSTVIEGLSVHVCGHLAMLKCVTGIVNVWTWIICEILDIVLEMKD